MSKPACGMKGELRDGRGVEERILVLRDCDSTPMMAGLRGARCIKQTNVLTGRPYQ